MKIGKYILRTVLFLLAAVAAGAAIYLYPTWKAAKTLREEMSLPYSSFELEVELNREELTEEQRKVIGTLTRLTGLQENALYRLFIEGSMSGDKVHLLIYPEGKHEPLFEFYLSSDRSVINETMLYNAVRSNLTEHFGLLKYLMPAQEETQYMTFRQVEQLFGVDLSGAAESIPPTAEEMDTKGYFLLLAAMSRERQGDGNLFSLDGGQVRMKAVVPGQGERQTAMLELRIENPGVVLEKGEKVLTLLKDRVPFPNRDDWVEKLQVVKGFSLVLTKGAEGTITIPDNLVSQEIIETISGIRAWVQDTFGNF